MQRNIIFPLLFITIFYSGCSSTNYTMQRPLNVSQNSYHEGSFFTYRIESKDEFFYKTEKIKRKLEQTIDWETNLNSTFTSYMNPFLPQVKWETWNKKSTLLSLNTGSEFLLPVETGLSKTLIYSNEVYDAKDESTKTYYKILKCAVSSKEKIEIALGTYDTYKIICEKNNYSNGYYYGSKTYYYSPKLRHWVLKIESFKKLPVKRTELISIQPNQSFFSNYEQMLFHEIRQETLEENISYTSKSIEQNNVSFKVTPIKSYRISNGVYCREFIEEYQLQDTIYPGNFHACRDGQYNWIRK